MEEKSLSQLAQEMLELIKRYEQVSAQLLSHAAFPHMINSTNVAKALSAGHDGLRESMHRSMESIRPEIEKLQHGLMELENHRDQIPADKLTN